MTKKEYFFSLLLCCYAPYSHTQSFSPALQDFMHSMFATPAVQQIPAAEQSLIKSLIFDLDGVLTTTNKMQAFYEVGITAILQYIYSQQSIPSEAILFEILRSVPARSICQSYNKGRLMPQIMIDWQINAQSLSAIQQAVAQYLQTAPYPQSQKEYALHTIQMLTTPQKFIRTRQAITPNVQLLHELKSKGYQLYVLSNWDKDSFPLLKANFPEIFIHNNQAMFNGIIISGDIGTVKPELEIFNKILDQYHLTPQESLFIDDEPANIAAAQQLDINSVLSNPNDTEKLRSDIIRHLRQK